MFRFTIRDVLLLTVIVALSVGWSIDRWNMGSAARQRDAARWHAEAVRRELVNAEHNESVLLDTMASVYGFGPPAADGDLLTVDWTLTERAIP